MLELFNKRPANLQRLQARLAPQQRGIIEVDPNNIHNIRPDFNENAMTALNAVQHLILQQLREKYAADLEAMGLDAILHGIKCYLSQEYLKNPARTQGDPVPLEVTLDEYGQVCDLQPPLLFMNGGLDNPFTSYLSGVILTENQKQALYQNSVYSALTVLQRPNYLISPNAEFAHKDHFNRPDSSEITEESKELLALLWIALMDDKFPYAQGFNADSAKQTLITILAGIARTHNLIENGVRVGQDNLGAYEPSCPQGIPNRLIKEYYQLVKAKSPLENPLDGSILKNLFFERMVAHNEKKTGIFDRITTLNVHGLQNLMAALDRLIINLDDFDDLDKNQKFALAALLWTEKTIDNFVTFCFEHFSEDRIISQRNPQIQYNNARYNNFGELIPYFLTNAYTIFSESILAKARNCLERIERENSQPFGNLDLARIKLQLAAIDVPNNGDQNLIFNVRGYIGAELSENEQLIVRNLKNRYQPVLNANPQITEEWILSDFKQRLVDLYQMKPAATKGARLDAKVLLTPDFASVNQHFERKANGAIYLKPNHAILDDEIIRNERRIEQFVFIETEQETRRVNLFAADLVPVQFIPNPNQPERMQDIMVDPTRFTQEQKRAIYNHPVHSALRYFFHVNSPLITQRPFSFAIRAQGLDGVMQIRPDIYPQAREFVAYLWLALNDPNYQLKDNLTKEVGIQLLIEALHCSNREYSQNGFRQDDPLVPDDPSCPGGGFGRIVRQCFIAIRDLEPQERVLNEEIFANRFKSMLIANNRNSGLFDTIEKLSLARLQILESALEKLYFTLEVDNFAQLSEMEKRAIQQLAWSNETIHSAIVELFGYFTEQRILARRMPPLRFAVDRFDNYGALFIHLCENATNQFCQALHTKVGEEIRRKEKAVAPPNAQAEAAPQPAIFNMQRLTLNAAREDDRLPNVGSQRFPRQRH